MANEIKFNHYATGRTLYFVVRNYAASVWNGSAFESLTVANWGNYDIAMSESPAGGYMYVGSFPAVGSGIYSVDVYEQSGRSAALTDTCLATLEFLWDGAREITQHQLEARRELGSRVWFLDADTGNDAYDGDNPLRAMKTLAALEAAGLAHGHAIVLAAAAAKYTTANLSAFDNLKIRMAHGAILQYVDAQEDAVMKVGRCCDWRGGQMYGQISSGGQGISAEYGLRIEGFQGFGNCTLAVETQYRYLDVYTLSAPLVEGENIEITSNGAIYTVKLDKVISPKLLMGNLFTHWKLVLDCTNITSREVGSGDPLAFQTDELEKRIAHDDAITQGAVTAKVAAGLSRPFAATVINCRLSGSHGTPFAAYSSAIIRESHLFSHFYDTCNTGCIGIWGQTADKRDTQALISRCVIGAKYALYGTHLYSGNSLSGVTVENATAAIENCSISVRKKDPNTTGREGPCYGVVALYGSEVDVSNCFIKTDGDSNSKDLATTVIDVQDQPGKITVSHSHYDKTKVSGDVTDLSADNAKLDAAISSRAAAADMEIIGDDVDDIALEVATSLGTVQAINAKLPSDTLTKINRLDMAVSDVASQTATATATAILRTPANKLDTDNNGFVIVGTNSDKSGYTLAGAGSGSAQCTLTITSNMQAVADADVWVTSDAGGTTVVAGSAHTNSNGKVTFMLDPGATYYLWMQKDGYNSIQGQAFTASAD